MSVYWVRRHLGATMIHIKSCLELEMNMDRAQYREREREAHKIRLHAHVGLMPWSQSSLPDLLRLQITKKRPDFILVSSTANQTVDSYPSMGGAYRISLWIVVYGVSHTTMHQQKPWRIGSTGATCRNMHNHPVPYVPPSLLMADYPQQGHASPRQRIQVANWVVWVLLLLLSSFCHRPQTVHGSWLAIAGGAVLNSKSRARLSLKGYIRKKLSRRKYECPIETMWPTPTN